MLINARPHYALCRSHKHKCLSACGGGLIKDIYISPTGTCKVSTLRRFCHFASAILHVEVTLAVIIEIAVKNQF